MNRIILEDCCLRGLCRGAQLIVLPVELLRHSRVTRCQTCCTGGPSHPSGLHRGGEGGDRVDT